MELTDAERLEILRERHLRLLAIAHAMLTKVKAAGTPEAPLCGVPPYLIKRLRRELRGDPQPSAFT